ncbi:hypothetical protein AMTRI_Chr07g28940 [Amborella trichopoda]
MRRFSYSGKFTVALLLFRLKAGVQVGVGAFSLKSAEEKNPEAQISGGEIQDQTYNTDYGEWRHGKLCLRIRIGLSVSSLKA